MECQGPDLNEARKFGKQVGEALFSELVKNYKMSESSGWVDSQKRWNKAKKSFIKSVEELFVEDACNSF